MMSSSIPWKLTTTWALPATFTSPDHWAAGRLIHWPSRAPKIRRRSPTETPSTVAMK
jgi:hypothetical protein